MCVAVLQVSVTTMRVLGVIVGVMKTDFQVYLSTSEFLINKCQCNYSEHYLEHAHIWSMDLFPYACLVGGVA